MIKTSVIYDFFLFNPTVFSETIKLKNGKTLEAKILEKTATYIKVDRGGTSITYYLDDVGSIDGAIPSKKIDETSFSQSTTTGNPSSGIDIRRTRDILKHLGYPENTWPEIERELTAFFIKIGLPKLKQEAARVKSNPEEFKNFVSRIGKLIEKEGCLNNQSPHPLIEILINSLGDEDIFQVIEASTISPLQKKESKELLVSCSAVSQLGSILLESLDINVKAVSAPGHVFNCVSLDDQRTIFIDFSNQVFVILDLSQYYKFEGEYQVLKKECRIDPKRVKDINEEWTRGVRPVILKEMLNSLYFYIYITNDYVLTPSIYGNRGNVYLKKGNFTQAISDYNKAIKIDSADAVAYLNRGVAYTSQGNLAQAISDCTKAIEINPNQVEAYANRGVAYRRQGSFIQAIADYNKALSLKPNDAETYINRGNAYDGQGDFIQAISDYGKAIEINSNSAEAYYNRGIAHQRQGNSSQAISDYTNAIKLYPDHAEAYYNRGVAYFYQKDFTKAWEDVHKAESLGGKVHPEFLEGLRKASGRQR